MPEQTAFEALTLNCRRVETPGAQLQLGRLVRTPYHGIDFTSSRPSQFTTHPHPRPFQPFSLHLQTRRNRPSTPIYHLSSRQSYHTHPDRYRHVARLRISTTYEIYLWLRLFPSGIRCPVVVGPHEQHPPRLAS